MSKYLPDRTLAKTLVEELDSASIGGFDAAEAVIARALELHPGLPFVYKKLADAYSVIDDHRNAVQCANGLLPIETLERKFSAYLKTFPGYGEPDERTLIHASREIKLPSQLDVPEIARDRSASIRTSNAFVDQCSDGGLWFDGFNRVLFNKSKQPVEGNYRGSAELISGLCNKHSALHIKGRVFLVGNRGYNNYYHWMLDILPSIELFKSAGFVFDHSDRFVLYSADTGFQKQSLLKVGVLPDQVIQLNRDTPYITADEVICPFFQNGMGLTMGSWVPEYLRTEWNVPDSVRNSMMSSDCAPANRMFWIARAENARNGRSITNNKELMRYLKQHHFEIVYPEKLSVLEQAALFANADVIAGIHGAGLANIAHCKPDTKVFEIYGAHLAPCYWAISGLGGLRYSNLQCNNLDHASHLKASTDKASLRTMDMTVDIDEFEVKLSGLLGSKDSAYSRNENVVGF